MELFDPQFVTDGTLTLKTGKTQLPETYVM